MEPVYCTGTCTVTLVITPQFPALTSEQIGDYMLLWSAILAAGVFVLCAKSLYQRFRIDHEKG